MVAPLPTDKVGALMKPVHAPGDNIRSWILIQHSHEANAEPPDQLDCGALEIKRCRGHRRRRSRSHHEGGQNALRSGSVDVAAQYESSTLRLAQPRYGDQRRLGFAIWR